MDQGHTRTRRASRSAHSRTLVELTVRARVRADIAAGRTDAAAPWGAEYDGGWAGAAGPVAGIITSNLRKGTFQ